ncbi:MAG: hypothetical protein E6J43_12755, partial [Chloroflexi bacterium]
EHRDDGLRLLGAYITAIVHCVPPGNKPTPQERDNCLPHLERELSLLPWRVIVALGSFAYDGVCRAFSVRKRPAFGHGVEAPLEDGRTIICSYHPSQQNTQTGRLTREMLDGISPRTRLAALSRTLSPKRAGVSPPWRRRVRRRRRLRCSGSHGGCRRAGGR